MKKIALVIVLASILAACGGGGDDKDGNPSSGTITVDQIAGTWVTECENSTNELSQPISGRAKFVLVKKSSTTFQVDVALSKYETYSLANCTGSIVASGPLEADSNEITIAGQKTIDGKIVSKINGTDTDGPWKDVIYYNDNKLYFGATDEKDPVDADGYPANLDMKSFFTKI